MCIRDRFYCYDPPYFVDTDNEVFFRGDVIYPKKIRLLEATWALTTGMGIYYRDSAGVYTDLTRFVEWEQQK